MREYIVWKALDRFLADSEFTIDGSCPPGGSDFSTSRCCFTHPLTGKQDEPDFLCHKDDILYLIECKPSWSGLCNQKLKNNGESDIEKLRRLLVGFTAGDYDYQLMHNHGIRRTKYVIRIAAAYAAKKIPSEPHYSDIDEFILSGDGLVVTRINST